MTNVTATITARDINTVLATDGSVEADVSVNGRHIAGVTLVTIDGRFESAGSSLDAWIDDINGVRSAAAQQAAGGFIDPAHGLDAAFDIMLDAIVDAVRGAA